MLRHSAYLLFLIVFASVLFGCGQSKEDDFVAQTGFSEDSLFLAGEDDETSHDDMKQPVGEYRSTDWRFFELRDSVRAFKYLLQECDDQGAITRDSILSRQRIYFSPSGHLLLIPQTQWRHSQPQIVRDKSGHISSVYWEDTDSLLGITRFYTTNRRGLIGACSIKAHHWRQAEVYLYDQWGTLTGAIVDFRQGKHFVHKEITYAIMLEDSHSNWTKRLVSIESSTFVRGGRPERARHQTTYRMETRKLFYY